jgi:hypothetical protein
MTLGISFEDLRFRKPNPNPLVPSTNNSGIPVGRAGGRFGERWRAEDYPPHQNASFTELFAWTSPSALQIQLVGLIPVWWAKSLASSHLPQGPSH